MVDKISRSGNIYIFASIFGSMHFLLGIEGDMFYSKIKIYRYIMIKRAYLVKFI